MNNKPIILSLFIVFIFLVSIPTIGGTQLKLDNGIIIKTLVDSPYSQTPDWVSDDPHYSTGGELADFNQDGWLDLVVSDGNDMEMGRVNVYYNDGNGNLSKTADWQSTDIGFNGHLDVADVNGDGWLDVAVSYLGNRNSKGPIARLYLNNDGELSLLPDWNANIIGNAFGVDFGDMNNDGRPDLAVATGWSYDGYYYPKYVYLNDDGELESTPSWVSDDTYCYQGVLWVDADDDGWLDLAGIGTGEETQIYKNLGGMLETTASWHTTDSSNQDGIMLAAGDVDGDGLRDLFTTDNTQLGGSGLFKQYNGLDTGFFETTYSWNYFGNYGSAVALADVNYDNKLDLATGGWWEYTRLFLNYGAGLPTTPSWSSAGATSSVGDNVVEKILFGNIGPKFNEYNLNEVFSPNGDQKLFYLSNKNIQKINSVKVDGLSLDFSEYTYSRDQGFVTINTIASTTVEINYNFSKSLDMVVTNWDPYTGNYMYFNNINIELTPNLDCQGELSWSDVDPGSTVEGSFQVLNIGDDFSSLNWEIESYPTDWGTWTFEPESGYGLTPGEGGITVNVNVVAPDEQYTEFTGELKVVNIDDTSDYEIIPVILKTPKNIQQSNQHKITKSLSYLLEQNQKLILKYKMIII